MCKFMLMFIEKEKMEVYFFVFVYSGFVRGFGIGGWISD